MVIAVEVTDGSQQESCTCDTHLVVEVHRFCGVPVLRKEQNFDG